METVALPSYPDLHGKVALVTGGSRGIGAATAQSFARHGVRVAVNGRDVDAIQAVVRSIVDSGGTAMGCAADCTDARGLDRIVASAEKELGPINIVAAFAGGGDVTATEQLTEAKWRSVLDANLTSTFLTVKSVLPGMMARKSGSIITMSSSAGRTAGLASVAYAAAKAGVVMLTGHLANELGKHGLRVNCIAPSAILTERLRARIPEAKQQEMVAGFPLGRIGVPDDVANAALYLASDASGWVTGMTMDVSGGRIIIS